MIYKNITGSFYKLIAIVFFLIAGSSAALAQTSNLSGAISLPDGQVADGDMSIGIAFSASGSTVRKTITIPDMASQVTYSFDYPEPSPTSDVYFWISCRFSDNCIAADGGFDSIFYLQDDGSVSINPNIIKVEDFPDVQDLQFPQLPNISTLSGTILLADGQVADGDLSIFVNFEDITTGTFFINNIVTIPDMASQMSFSIDYPTKSPGPGSYVTLYFRCISATSNCESVDGNLDTAFFVQENGSISNGYSEVLIENINDPLNLKFPQLEPIETLSGTVSLPAGEVSDGDLSLTLLFFDQTSYGLLNSQTVVFPYNASQVDFSFDYRKPSPSSMVSLSLKCSGSNSSCASIDRDTNTSFYLQKNGSVSNSNNTIQIEDLSSPLDLQLPPLPTIATLTGTLILPAGQIANGDMRFTISIYDQTNTVTIAHENVEIPDKASQVDYSFAYQKPSLGSEIRLSVNCIPSSGDCTVIDGDVGKGFYLQDDGSVSDSSNTLLIDDLPDSQDLQFPIFAQTSTLSGTISLPAGQVADGDLFIAINFDDVTTGTFFEEKVVMIAGMASQASFSIDYPTKSPGPGSDVNLYFRCLSAISDCAAIDGNLDTIFYMQDDRSISKAYGEVLIDDLSDPVDLQFPALVTIKTLSGTIFLPAGEVAEGDVSISIRLYDDQSYTSFYFGNVVIPDMASQVDYSFDYPAPSPDSEVGLNFRCQLHNSNCDSADGGLGVTFYLQDDGSISRYSNQVSIESLSETQDLQFPPLRSIETLSGTVLLPAGEIADGDMIFNISLFESFQTSASTLGVQTVTIPDMASKADYSFDYQVPTLDAEVDAEVLLRITCNSSLSNCTPAYGDKASTFYLQNDGSISSELNTLAIENLGDIRDLQFPNTANQGDVYEEDNSTESASSIAANESQDRSIHQAGDVDWVGFTILDGDTEISITTNSENIPTQFSNSEEGDLTQLSLSLYDNEYRLIETGRDSTTDAELEDVSLLEIKLATLAPGEYLIKIEGVSPGTEKINYKLGLALIRQEDGMLCFPIVSQNEDVTIMCL